MPAPFTSTRRVEFIDTDMVGIVHYSNFARYAEQAESEFFRSLGLALVVKQDDGTMIGWPRLTSSFSFKAPAFFEDILDIRISVSRIGAKSLTLDFEFQREETLIATGQLKTAYCRFSPDEPLTALEIPEPCVQKLKQFLSE